MVVSLSVSARSHLHLQRQPFLPVCFSWQFVGNKNREVLGLVSSSILGELKKNNRSKSDIEFKTQEITKRNYIMNT